VETNREKCSTPTIHGRHFAVLKEAYVEEGMSIPSPSPSPSISVERLSELSDLVKVSRLAELSGIPG